MWLGSVRGHSEDKSYSFSTAIGDNISFPQDNRTVLTLAVRSCCSQNKLCLVLDLDHTLLNSVMFSELDQQTGLLLEEKVALEEALPPNQRMLYQLLTIRVLRTEETRKLMKYPMIATLTVQEGLGPTFSYALFSQLIIHSFARRCTPSCALACGSSSSGRRSCSSSGSTPTVCYPISQNPSSHTSICMQS